jgi:hypothetical protein
VALFLLVWIAMLPNVYGWLTGETQTFVKLLGYAADPRKRFDPSTDQALYWLIGAVPLALHWSLPSYVVPRTWAAEGTLRALIAATIVAYTVLVAVVAWFYRRLASDAAVSTMALGLFVLGPTFWFLCTELDTRFLSLLAALPAAIVLLARAGEPSAERTPRELIAGFALPGALFGAALLLSDETRFLEAPFVLAYAFWTLLPNPRARRRWIELGALAAGFALWSIAIELISLAYHPFGSSILVALAVHAAPNVTLYTRLTEFARWIGDFASQAGWPLLVAAAFGVTALLRNRRRASYIEPGTARIIGTTTLLAPLIGALSSLEPYYQAAACFQPLLSFVAAVGVERAAAALRLRGRSRFAGLALGLVAVAWVPFARTVDVVVAHQGLGRAVALAHRLAGTGKVDFLVSYDWDVGPRAVTSPAALEALDPNDYLVTTFPLNFYMRYPDLLALFHDTEPVAAFPTEWCTREAFVETAAYFNGRPWYREPELCQARVYRVAALLAAAGGRPLPVAEVNADSEASARQSPLRVLSERSTPAGGADIYGDPRFAGDLWSSAPVALDGPGDVQPHWLHIAFARPIALDRVTVVAPDYTYFDPLYELEVYDDRGRLLWRGSGLAERQLIDVTFARTTVRGLRLVILRQGPSPFESRAAIAYVRIPGYVPELEFRAASR